VAFRSKRYYMLGKVMTKRLYGAGPAHTGFGGNPRAHGLENGLVTAMSSTGRFSARLSGSRRKRYPLNFEKIVSEGDLSQNLPSSPEITFSSLLRL